MAGKSSSGLLFFNHTETVPSAGLKQHWIFWHDISKVNDSNTSQGKKKQLSTRLEETKTWWSQTRETNPEVLLTM